MRAAKDEFDASGWAAATIRSIARRAEVSPKTVEALFATKPALLEATLVVAFGGDHGRPVNGDGAVIRPDVVFALRVEAARQIEEAPDAGTMLELTSAVTRDVNARAEGLCWAVETAVASDERLAELLARMIAAQRYGAHWTAELLLQKPGVRADLTLREAEETILPALDWNTYRTLTIKGGLTPHAAHAWNMGYYRRMLLQ